MTRAQRFDVGLVFLTTLACLAPFLPGLSGEYLYDDYRFVRDNPAIRDADAPLRFFLDPTTVDPGGGSEGIYRPLRTLSYALEAVVFGTDGADPGPVVRHRVNWSLHVLGVILLFFFMRRRLSAVPSALVAILYGIHPVHVEAVVWITSRDNPLCFVFSMAVLMLEPFRGGGIPRRFLAWAAFACALSSRETAVALPFIIGALLWCEGGGRSGSNAVKHRWCGIGLGARVVAPYLVITIAYLGLRSSVLGSGFSQRGPWEDSYGITAMTQVVGYAYYLVRLVVPVLPSWFPFDYQLAPVRSVFDPRFLASALIVLAWVVILVERLRLRRPDAVYLLWFPVLLLPVLNPILPVNILVTDRFLYAAAVGPFALWGMFLEAKRVSAPRLFRVGVVASVAAGLGLASLTFWVSGVFATPDRFWSEVVDRSPESFRAQHGLGCAMFDRGDPPAAITALSKAVEIEPSYAIAHKDLGMVLLSLGRSKESLRCFENAVQAWEAKGSIEGNRDFRLVCVHLAQSWHDLGNEEKAFFFEAKVAALSSNRKVTR